MNVNLINIEAEELLQIEECLDAATSFASNNESIFCWAAEHRMLVRFGGRPIRCTGATPISFVFSATKSLRRYGRCLPAAFATKSSEAKYDNRCWWDSH